MILVTGASGFIGSHVVKRLLDDGRSVRASVRDASDPGRVAHLHALAEGSEGTLEVVEADLLDAESMAASVAGSRM